MEKTIDTIVKYLQSKNTTFTVAEINEISQMLVALKPKNPLEDKETTSEVTASEPVVEKKK